MPRDHQAFLCLCGSRGTHSPKSFSSCPSSVTSMSPGKGQTLPAHKENENSPGMGLVIRAWSRAGAGDLIFPPTRPPIWPAKLLALTYPEVQSLFVPGRQREKASKLLSSGESLPRRQNHVQRAKHCRQRSLCQVTAPSPNCANIRALAPTPKPTHPKTDSGVPP